MKQNGRGIMLKDLILQNRSYRRFREKHKIDPQILTDLVDCARLSASASNKQPLKYILSFTKDMNEQIFPHLRWAGYLKDWAGPQPGERPAAYIVILGDTSISQNFYCDHGIAAQSILLAATEKELGGCIVASIEKDNLRKAIKIPAHLEILLVIALGKPGEKIVLEKVNKDHGIEYWRDEQDVHHVPKRALQEIIIMKK